MWAFGTSQQGLALTSERLWDLTGREYDALRRIWQAKADREFSMYAEQQANIRNAPHRTKPNGQPYSAEDFGGKPAKKPDFASGRVATQSPEHQRLVFEQMLGNAAEHVTVIHKHRGQVN